jgi:hypothetical protein
MKNNNVFKLFLFSSILFLMSCDKQAVLGFEEYGYDKTIGNCDEGICVDIHLKYFVLHEPTNIAEEFNPLMEAMVYGKMGVNNNEGILDIEKKIQLIIDDYETQLKEFPDAAAGGYQQNTSSVISFESSNIVCINVLTDSYSGGAHGMYWDEYLNIDPLTGKRLNILDMINNKDAFNSYIENELRNKIGMKASDKWSEFTFLDQFTLPENMGFTESGLRLVYNSYELLSYAEGMTEIVIPNEKLKEFMDLP